MYKPENEPVKVVAYFDTKIKILKFKFGNTVYKVSEQISYWKEMKGENKFSYYTLKCAEQNFLCELQFNHTDLKWVLIHWDILY
ncbi:MAG TPA: hypothetical protein VHP32_01830 [Ignavibacteria bacterium]|nr:hypothetical protein [Ignavibacteria bacterium]